MIRARRGARTLDGQVTIGADGPQREITADWIALNDIGPDPESFLVIVEASSSPALFERFKAHAGENPLVRRHAH